MPRTTIDIDAAVLRELKRRQRTQGRTLGQLASELLAAALAAPPDRSRDDRPFRWTTQAMGARVDIEDKEAVRKILDDA